MVRNNIKNYSPVIETRITSHLYENDYQKLKIFFFLYNPNSFIVLYEKRKWFWFFVKFQITHCHAYYNTSVVEVKWRIWWKIDNIHRLLDDSYSLFFLLWEITFMGLLSLYQCFDYGFSKNFYSLFLFYIYLQHSF